MKMRWVAFIVCLCAVWAASASAAPYKPIPVYSEQADDLMSMQLAQDFGEEWDLQTGLADPVKCKKVGYSHARCKIGWVYGDVAIFGNGHIWMNHRAVAEWNYSYNLIRLDEYCLFVREKTYRQCTDRIRVR